MKRLAFVVGLFYFIFFTDLDIRVYWTLMRHKVVFYLLIILLWPTLGLKGQDVSTSGTDFWFGFMQNLDDGLPSSLEVFITSAQNAFLLRLRYLLLLLRMPPEPLRCPDKPQ